MHDLTSGSVARATARAASARKSPARFTPRQLSPPMCNKRRRLNTGFKELLGASAMNSFLGYATALQAGAETPAQHATGHRQGAARTSATQLRPADKRTHYHRYRSSHRA